MHRCGYLISRHCRILSKMRVVVRGLAILALACGWLTPQAFAAAAMDWEKRDHLSGQRQLLGSIQQEFEASALGSGAEEGQRRSRGRKQVVVLSVPGFSFAELEPEWLSAMPRLRQMLPSAAWGAMNVRIPGGSGIDRVYATWGAGQYAEAAGAMGWDRLTRDRRPTEAAIKLRRYAGGESDGEPGSIVIPGIARMRAANAESPYLPAPGLLGDTLRQHGVLIGVWGNLDAGTCRASAGVTAAPSCRRYAPLMAMSGDGTVAAGSVESGTQEENDSWPLGVRTSLAGFLVRLEGKIGSAAAAPVNREGEAKAGRRERPQAAASRGDQSQAGVQTGKESLSPAVVQLKGSRVQAESRVNKEGESKTGTVNESAIASKATGAETVLEADEPMLWIAEIGDLYRLYEERSLYAPERFREAKRETLARLDEWIGELSESERTVLWLVSPKAHPEALKRKLQLTPVMRWNREAAGGGLLASATTRRPGFVASVDLAPTLLAEYGLAAPGGMSGLRMAIAPPEKGDVAFDGLLKEVERSAMTYALRPPLLIGLAIYEVIVMLAGLIWCLLLSGGVRKGKRTADGRAFAASGKLLAWGELAMRGALFLVLLVPAALLGMGWLPGGTPPLLILAAGLAPAGLGAALLARYTATPRRLMPALAGVGLCSALLIAADALAGAPGMKHSVLGYDPMIGARYYGIGNEFMGVLIGSAALGLTALGQAWLERRRASAGAGGDEAAAKAARTVRWLALAAGAALAAALASSAVGANAGGALAAAAAFAALGARLAAGPGEAAPGPGRLALALAVPLAAAAAGLWLAGAAGTAPAESAAAAAGFGGGSGAGAALGAAAAGPAGTGLDARAGSHIERAIAALAQGRFELIAAIIRRKLAMNLHLIGVSAWSKVLLTGIVVMAALLWRPRGRIRRWQSRYPLFMHGCSAVVVGTVAALVLNDSGIVAAATMIVYGSVPMLLLRLSESPKG